MADEDGTDDDDALDDHPALESRDDNLAKRAGVRKKLRDLFTSIEQGFDAQQNRSTDLEDYWDIYNCKLGVKQYYSGNAEIFVPIVYEAVEARKTRFANQVFPPSNRNIDCISSDATLPHAMIALGENYIRRAKIRQLIKPLLLNGDIEGQYSIYVRWSDAERHIVKRVKTPVEDDGVILPSSEDVDDIEEDTIKAAHPVVEIISDCDLLVLPTVADSLEDALERGGSITILRRWSKEKLEKMIADEDIDSKTGKDLIKALDKPDNVQRQDHEKKMVDAAGIKSDARGKYCLVYETWSRVKTPDGKRLCRTFFAGAERILSCKRNPLWCDRLPIISCAAQKVDGSFKGRSLIDPVATLQYYANDMLNEAADSSAYSMLPIIMTDPEKNPRVGSMVMSLAAVWLTNPNDTKFAQFPQIWKDGLAIVAQIKQEIFQALSVNPARITQGANKKMSQAEVANEQQIDVLTTAETVTTLEEGILTPLITLFMELDHQYREDDTMVPSYGEMGKQVQMQSIEPIQLDHRYEFVWRGVEAARSAQQMQQQISGLNVLKGIPPQLYQGYKLNMAPALVQMVENLFGPRIGPLIFEDLRTQLSDDPKTEVEMAVHGIESPVHEMANHRQAMMMLAQAIKQTGDPTGVIRTQLMKHQQILVQQQQAQQQPKGLPGTPGGAGPGAAGAPRPGATPMQQRPAQQPPGAIHNDQIGGMPRRPA